MLTTRIERDGEPVTDLEPYLGAFGHLVALRAGDLAYLHVHPEEGEPGPGDRLRDRVPRRRATYRLFLDFQHGGVVRTAAFTVESSAARQPPAPTTRRATMTTETTTEPLADVELAITGMTCASCANRIERKLNKLDGVTATVNYATEKAQGHLSRRASPPTTCCATVEAAGYAAALPDRRPTPTPRRPSPSATRCCQRLLVSAVLTVPVVAMAMVPALQFTYWQWLSLTLAAPVVVWGALAVPPRRVDQPAPRRDDDGHPRLGRRARRLRLVAVRAVPRHRRRARA